MPTIGEDCHLILYHPDLNAGLGVGFLVAEGTAIAAQRSALETIPGQYTEHTKLFASVFCADYVRLPNGGRDARTRLQVYQALAAYLSKRSQIAVATPAGIFAGLFCMSHLATESHYGGHSIIVCTFSSLNAAFVPADPVAYENSLWVDLTTYTGPRTWGNSHWRT